MSKLTKIIFLFVILFSLLLNITYATENVVETIEDGSTTISSDTNDSEQSTLISNFSGVTSVSQLSNYSEANLGLNNILSIILIAIGVLLILLAIAILIRLKH